MKKDHHVNFIIYFLVTHSPSLIKFLGTFCGVFLVLALVVAAVKIFDDFLGG